MGQHFSNRRYTEHTNKAYCEGVRWKRVLSLMGEIPILQTFSSDEGSEWLKELWYELYVEFRDDWSFWGELMAVLEIC